MEPVEYLNGSLFSVRHPEGRLAQDTTYEYFLTDHLGNVRAVMEESGTIIQETEYYIYEIGQKKSWSLSVILFHSFIKRNYSCP